MVFCGQRVFLIKLEYFQKALSVLSLFFRRSILIIMCTLTYIPLPDGQYVLTDNRDEHILRPMASFPSSFATSEGKQWWAPIDPQGGGTWIGSEAYVKTLCLLNGAFQSHIRKPSYRKSRGLIVKELLESSRPFITLQNMDLSGIEPFTLILVKHSPVLRIIEAVWDEAQLYIKDMDTASAHIWSSTPLYNPEQRMARQQLFNDFLAEKPSKLWSVNDAWDFHHNKEGLDASNAILMQRKLMRTMSTTSIWMDKQWKMRYKDQLKEEEVTIALSE